MKKHKLHVSVFDFNDYRSFLKAAYEECNERDRNFSYSFIQRKAGFSSTSNHFWQIVEGRSPLSRTAATRYARAFGLSSRESQYLSLMSAMNQAKSDKDRNEYLRQMRQFRETKQRKSGSDIRWEYYEEWYLPALRAMVTLDDFEEAPKSIAKRMFPKITPHQAEKGIERLLDLGFLERDSKGKLVQSNPFIGQPEDRTDRDPVARLAVRNYHRAMIRLAEEAIDGQSQDHRFVVGSTLALSKNQSEKIRELAEDFLSQVEEIVAEDEPIEEILRVNLQLFKLCRERPGKKSRTTTNDKTEQGVKK